MLAIVSLEVPLALQLGRRVDAEVRSQSTSQADVIAATAAEPLRRNRVRALDELARTAGQSARGRVVIVDRRGRLVADSAEASTLGTYYGNRPEIAAALEGRGFQDTRRSQTLQAEILATAAPVIQGKRIEGAVRITQSVAAVHHAVRRNVLGLALIGLLVLGIGLGVGAVIAGQFARPVRRLDRAARRIAEGDLDARAPVEGSSEQRSLSHSFNEMTDRLSRAIRAQQRFVADASHQLRTPLTGLRLRLEEARDAGVSEEAARGLEAGDREIERLARTIDELLVLSRAGEHDAPGEIVRPRAGGGGCDRAVEHDRRGARAATRAERRSGRPHVGGARRRRPRARRAGRERGALFAAGDAHHGQLQRRRDRGRGRRPRSGQGEEDEVFERFHRGRAATEGAPGTGLGLPIARELARRWGGDATIENRNGRGARAVLRFPDFTNRSPGGG